MACVAFEVAPRRLWPAAALVSVLEQVVMPEHARLARCRAHAKRSVLSRLGLQWYLRGCGSWHSRRSPTIVESFENDYVVGYRSMQRLEGGFICWAGESHRSRRAVLCVPMKVYGTGGSTLNWSWSMLDISCLQGEISGNLRSTVEKTSGNGGIGGLDG